MPFTFFLRRSSECLLRVLYFCGAAFNGYLTVLAIGEEPLPDAVAAEPRAKDCANSLGRR